MDDYIRRADVIAELNAEGYTKNTRFHKRFLAIPAAHVAPVVLCRDCRYYEKFREGEGDAVYGWCDTHNICVHNYFFCADGERREGGADG